MSKFFLGLCFGAFVILMAMRGAAVRDERDALAVRVAEQGRVIEQLANRPTPAPIVVRVPGPVQVVREPGPRWSVVFFLGAVFFAAGIILVTVLITRGAAVQGGALHPGEPGFDEAVNRAAGAVGGAVVRYEGAYWLMVPGREPERVRRLIEQKG